MDGYREFWNAVFYGESQFLGTSDIQTYWIRLILIAGAFLLAGVASNRLRWLPIVLTALLLSLYATSVAPFMIWAARCGGCGASYSADSARSYEAILINQWWGGLIAIAVSAVWIGAAIARGRRAPRP